MAATNFTPIQLYFSTTASAVPTAANLAQGELAINITDGKLYYEDNAGAVQVIATKGAGTIGGSTTQIQYNNAGALAGSAAMVFNSGTNTTTLTTLNLTNALGATYGGTAQSTYAQGDFLYASAANTLSKLGIGANTYILTSTGSVPQWVAPSSIAVLTATNLAGGLAGSVPYQSALDTTTFLSIGSANRVMTSTGTAPQWVTSLTGLTGVSSSSITNTSLTSGRVVVSTTAGLQADDADLTFDGTTLSAGGFSTVGLSTLVKTVKIGDSSFNGVAVFAAATPAKLYMGTGTVTDVTSAISATNAIGAIASLGITPIAATNTSVTYTNASTLYIAGAPSAGTNITLTNPYSLYVASGASYFGGAVDFAVTPSYSGGTANGVMYLNGSKQITTGSALTFDGSAFAVTGAVSASGSGLTPLSASSDYVNGTIATLDNTNATSRGSCIGFKQGGVIKLYVGLSGVVLGDTSSDTLIYAETGKSIKLYANGNSAATLDSSGLEVKQSQLIGYSSYAGIGTNGLAVAGKVGIGTASPTLGLTVEKDNGSGYIAAFRANNTSPYLTIQTTSSITQIQGINSAFSATNDIAMQLSGGNVGIGTATPASKLSIAAPTTAVNADIELSNSAGVKNYVFTGGSTNATTRWQNNLVLYTGGAQSILFETNGANRMNLDSAGNLTALGEISVKASTYNWDTAFSVAKLGDSAAVAGLTNDGFLVSNGYYKQSVGWYAIANKPVYIYQQNPSADGGHIWQRAPAAGANAAIALVNQMTLDANAALILDGGTGKGRITLENDATANTIFSTLTAFGSYNILRNRASQHQWLDSAGAQAMTLTAAGNLLIGQTVTKTDEVLRVASAGQASMLLDNTGKTNGACVGVFNDAALFGINRNPSTGVFYNASNYAADIVLVGNSSTSYISFETAAVANTIPTERARITSDGDLLVGTTTSIAGAARLAVLFAGNATDGFHIQDSTTTSGSVFQAFSNSAGTSIGNIARVTTTNAVVYNTTSDYRLKTVVGPVADAGQRIDALQPVEYTWNSNGSRTRGFLAHQFQEVYANSVTGTKDAIDAKGNPIYQQMQSSTSEVIADLVAEIQSLRKRLAALEAA